MKRLFVLITFFSLNLFPQHLPLQVGNQWHYDYGLAPSAPNAAIAVDSVLINNKLYYKIECRQPVTNNLLWTTYDRLEGDSLYFRLFNGVDSVIFNFGWPNGYFFTIPLDTCISLIFIQRYTTAVWGINTDYYCTFGGEYCPGWSDTIWALSCCSYTKYFGSNNAGDGRLIGALINGTTYGTLHPLPVELVSFTAGIISDKVNLEWETASEINNKGFELYRKDAAKGSRYKLLAFIPGAGTTGERQFYRYSDNYFSNDKIFYKLIQYDFDGSIKKTAEVEVDGKLTNSFSLSQNYPNPFNPVTRIDYEVKEQAMVLLKVYSLLGDEIAVLVNEEKSPGRYSVNFNASHLSSGVYFYKLSAGGNFVVKSMMVMK